MFVHPICHTDISVERIDVPSVREGLISIPIIIYLTSSNILRILLSMEHFARLKIELLWLVASLRLTALTGADRHKLRIKDGLRNYRLCEYEQRNE